MNHPILNSISNSLRNRVLSASTSLKYRNGRHRDAFAVLNEMIEHELIVEGKKVIEKAHLLKNSDDAFAKEHGANSLKSVSMCDVRNLTGGAPYFITRHFERIPNIKQVHVDLIKRLWNDMQEIRPHWFDGVTLLLRVGYHDINSLKQFDTKGVITAGDKRKPTWRAW